MMDVQVENAIQIAWNPQSEQSLKLQAFDFLNQLRANPSAWLLCLSLFTRQPRPSEVVRHVALEVVNNGVQSQQLDAQNAISAKIGIMDYVRQNYGPSADQSSVVDTPAIQNKVAQTLTYLFTVLYGSGWESFFHDFEQLSEAELRQGRKPPTATLFYLRILASVHDEIADVNINTAPEKQKLHTELKDLVRARDIGRIAASWKTMLSQWQSIDPAATELCLKVIARWVSWSDISLVANPDVLENLFQIAGQHDTGLSDSTQSRVRNAAIDVFTETVGKKMKPPEKIQLIQFMNLNTVVERLVSASPLDSARGTPNYDTDMAETVAKLVNTTVADVVECLNADGVDDRTRDSAATLLQLFTPHLLRFLADEYDEVCSTIIPALTDQLGLFRKLSKTQGGLPSPYKDMILPILNALIAKMRYDDTSSWSEEEEGTDEAEFQELRKRLRVAQQSVAAIDEDLFMNTIANLIESTFARLRSDPQGLNWRDLDLAVLQMSLLGELTTKNGGLYARRNPNPAVSRRMINQMILMMDSGVASYNHPTMQLQYMDLCVRFYAFFEKNSQYIPKVLEDFIRFCHSPTVKVRLRAWHTFFRFVQRLRKTLGNVAETVVQALSDLLPIKAVVTEDDASMSSDLKDQSEDSAFSSQLFLFEAIGCVTSISPVPIDTQTAIAQSTLEPLISSIQASKEPATSEDEQAILQIHHSTEAIGTLARGFSDWVPGKSSNPVPDSVSSEFQKASDTILAALNSLKGSETIRNAARFTFSRLVGVLGFRILQQLPEWIDGLLSESSSKDEIATFLRLLDQIIFGFKSEIYDVLNTLLTPLIQRIFTGLSQPTTGTDDEMQLGDLRREYLGFLLVLLNNSLDSVLISELNQGIFDTVFSTIEHFAKDAREQTDGKLAVSLLIKMCEVWGGPTVFNTKDNTSGAPSPSLNGFDRFMITRLSGLTWAIVTHTDFHAREPLANRVLADVAALQQTILAKTGREYLTWLREQELRNLGLQQAAIDGYLHALTTMDSKAFKQYLTLFLDENRGA